LCVDLIGLSGYTVCIRWTTVLVVSILFSFTMSITRYTVLDFPEEKFLENRKSRCTYPWVESPVGAGFHVPFSDLGEKKTKPEVPKTLQEKGVVYEYAKLPSGYLFKRIS